MTGIVLVTHGSLGVGLIDAAALICGRQAQLEAVSLQHGDSPELLDERLQAAINRADTGDGVLVLVDFYGGTPANVTAQRLRFRQFCCVCGVNLPMLLEVLGCRQESSADELEQMAETIGRYGICRMSQRIEAMTSTAANDF